TMEDWAVGRGLSRAIPVPHPANEAVRADAVVEPRLFRTGLPDLKCPKCVRNPGRPGCTPARRTWSDSAARSRDRQSLRRHPLVLPRLRDDLLRPSTPSLEHLDRPPL